MLKQLVVIALFVGCASAPVPEPAPVAAPPATPPIPPASQVELHMVDTTTLANITYAMRFVHLFRQDAESEAADDEVSARQILLGRYAGMLASAWLVRSGLSPADKVQLDALVEFVIRSVHQAQLQKELTADLNRAKSPSSP